MKLFFKKSFSLIIYETIYKAMLRKTGPDCIMSEKKHLAVNRKWQQWKPHSAQTEQAVLVISQQAEGEPCRSVSSFLIAGFACSPLDRWYGREEKWLFSLSCSLHHWQWTSPQLAELLFLLPLHQGLKLQVAAPLGSDLHHLVFLVLSKLSGKRESSMVCNLRPCIACGTDLPGCVVPWLSVNSITSVCTWGGHRRVSIYSKWGPSPELWAAMPLLDLDRACSVSPAASFLSFALTLGNATSMKDYRCGWHRKQLLAFTLNWSSIGPTLICCPQLPFPPTFRLHTRLLHPCVVHAAPLCGAPCTLAWCTAWWLQCWGWGWGWQTILSASLLSVAMRGLSPLLPITMVVVEAGSPDSLVSALHMWLYTLPQLYKQHATYHKPHRWLNNQTTHFVLYVLKAIKIMPKGHKRTLFFAITNLWQFEKNLQVNCRAKKY